MDNFIALSVKTEDEADDLGRGWYKCVRDTLPDGILDTFSVGDGRASMKRKVTKGRVVYTIKLLRNVTEREVKAVSDRLGTMTKKDFTVSSSVLELNVAEEVPVKVDASLAQELALKWAREEHEQWMKKALDNGWQYGVKLDKKEKRHPLLRPFQDLPESYRAVDMSRIEDLMHFLNESGYIIVPKADLSK